MSNISISNISISNTPATSKQCTLLLTEPKQKTSEKQEIFVVSKNYSIMKRYEYDIGNKGWRYLS
jgi:hypothetical protein